MVLKGTCAFELFVTILPNGLSWSLRFHEQVDHEDKSNTSLNAFNELWKSKFAHDSLLVFSTGRSHALYSDLRVGILCFSVSVQVKCFSMLLSCSLFIPQFFAFLCYADPSVLSELST